MTIKNLAFSLALATAIFASQAAAAEPNIGTAGSGTPFNFKTPDAFTKTLNENCNGSASCSAYLGHCLRQPGDAACHTYLKEFSAGAIKLYGGEPDICTLHPDWPICQKVLAE